MGQKVNPHGLSGQFPGMFTAQHGEGSCAGELYDPSNFGNMGC